jgi:hypothetical protein
VGVPGLTVGELVGDSVGLPGLSVGVPSETVGVTEGDPVGGRVFS